MEAFRYLPAASARTMTSLGFGGLLQGLVHTSGSFPRGGAFLRCLAFPPCKLTQVASPSPFLPVPVDVSICLNLRNCAFLWGSHKPQVKESKRERFCLAVSASLMPVSRDLEKCFHFW